MAKHIHIHIGKKTADVEFLQKDFPKAIGTRVSMRLPNGGEKSGRIVAWSFSGATPTYLIRWDNGAKWEEPTKSKALTFDSKTTVDADYSSNIGQAKLALDKAATELLSAQRSDDIDQDGDSRIEDALKLIRKAKDLALKIK